MPETPAGAGPVPSDLHELGEIIRAYSEAAAGLQESHRLLQEQVKQLSGELQRKNDELSRTVTQVSSLKNYLASIIDSSADGIVAIGLDRRVMAWNPAANMLAAIAGPLPDRPEGMFILDAMPGPCRDLGHMLMRSLQEDRSFTGVEMRLADRKGRTRVLSASASPVRSSDGGGAFRTIGAVQIFSELTELRELEEKLNRRDRLVALGEMAAGVAHEIRNPLGGIDLYASSLGRKFPEGSPERATCGKIVAAVSSLNRIVTDMLTFTRGRQPQPRETPARQVLRTALDLAAREIEAKAITTETMIDDEKRRFPLDPDQVSQALLNVILNAVQAMEEGGSLVLSARVETAPGGGESLAISCADDGKGIPPEAREKIFNPFFTLRKDGTGLGLAIVHKIIQDHGGSIDVRDNRPKGTVVTFRLPA